jgi:hypothetical protein
MANTSHRSYQPHSPSIDYAVVSSWCKRRSVEHPGILVLSEFSWSLFDRIQLAVSQTHQEAFVENAWNDESGCRQPIDMATVRGVL